MLQKVEKIQAILHQIVNCDKIYKKQAAISDDKKTPADSEQEDGLALPETAEQLQEIIEKMASSDMEQAYFTECFLPVREEGGRWYRVEVICSVPHTIV